MTEQEKEKLQTPEQTEQTSDQDLGDFISRMTEGLEEIPMANTVSQEQPASSQKVNDQGSLKDASEGAPSKGSQSPDTEIKGEKPQSENASVPKENKQTVDVEEHFDKSGKAFAEMRIQNKQKESFILELAKAAGFEVRDAQDAMDKLKINLTNIEAKKKNVDPLVLQQLQQREAQLAEQEKLQLRQEAHAGFDKLKAQFNLDDNKLVAFAQQLQAAGINPFEQKVNIEHEYKLRNFDALITQAKEAGRQEEIARRTKVQTSATIPSGKVGSTQDTGESIDSVDKLKTFLGIK